MRRNLLLLSCLALAAAAPAFNASAQSQAQDDARRRAQADAERRKAEKEKQWAMPQAELPTESIGETVLPFPPSPHRAYIVDVEFENFIAGRVTVVDPEQKKMLGMVSTGFVAPSTLSHDAKTLYSADTFYSRGTRGVRTDVLTAWDTSNLRPTWEVEIPAKRASILTQKYALGTSSDDRFVYIYNFTPSTSVTVVDTQAKKVASEIAISGCVLNYPVANAPSPRCAVTVSCRSPGSATTARKSVAARRRSSTRTRRSSTNAAWPWARPTSS